MPLIIQNGPLSCIEPNGPITLLIPIAQLLLLLLVGFIGNLISLQVHQLNITYTKPMILFLCHPVDLFNTDRDVLAATYVDCTITSCSPNLGATYIIRVGRAPPHAVHLRMAVSLARTTSVLNGQIKMAGCDGINTHHKRDKLQPLECSSDSTPGSKGSPLASPNWEHLNA